MAPNSLSPAYIVINYHSPFGAHKMTLPTREYAIGTPTGTFLSWAGPTVDALDMVNDFVDLIAPFFPATVSFDFYEVFTKADATADSVFAEATTLSQVGTSASGGWAKASEAVFSLKTLANGEYKVALLDFDSGDGWDKITFAGLAGASLAFVNYLLGGTHAFSGRDDNRPGTFRQISYGLNAALRRKYGMN